ADGVRTATSANTIARAADPLKVVLRLNFGDCCDIVWLPSQLKVEDDCSSACSISIRRRLVGYLLFVADHHDGELLFHHILFHRLLHLLGRYGVISQTTPSPCEPPVEAVP